ncbi:hypothetical protein GCM10009720_20910 [Yaniella flava]|uniref:Chemotaxis protein n=1 Tax=Yaniella flava TaxID=287930 RepID=A0ABN2UP37_9MICC
MYFRDKFFLASGFVLALLGSFATFFWRIEAGIVALLLVSILVLVFLTLLRRQVSKVQQRTLALLHFRGTVDNLSKDLRRAESVSTKKIIGLLHAQQMSMEELSDRLEAIAEDKSCK